MAYQLERFDENTPPLADATPIGERSMNKEEGKLIASQLMADVSELQALMIGAGTPAYYWCCRGLMRVAKTA